VNTTPPATAGWTPSSTPVDAVHDHPPVAASNATSRPSAVGTNTVRSATAAGALIAAPTDADHWMAPVAGSSAYIVPAFVPTYSASPSTGDTDEVPSSGVLQSGI
jgi:hypothetical protein